MTKHINLALSEKQYDQIRTIVESGAYRNMSDFVRSCTVIQLEKYNGHPNAKTKEPCILECDPG